MFGPIQKAAIVGGGGTVVYCALLVAVAFAVGRSDSDGGMALLFGLSAPIIPSCMPGLIAGMALTFLGVRGFGVDDLGGAVLCLISAAVVNAYLYYLWIKHRALARRA
jgi:hypothetical protein